VREGFINPSLFNINMRSSNTFSKINTRDGFNIETKRSSNTMSVMRASRASQASRKSGMLQTKFSYFTKLDESKISSDSAQSLTEYYRYEIQKSTETKQYKQALDFCKKYKEILTSNSDHSRLQHAFKLQGNIYMKMNDVKNALFSYRNLKGIAEYNGDYLEKIVAYQKIGHCYKLLKQYKLALVNFKKMLQLSWDINSLKYEFLAYDSIGLQYFYLGDIERARYYHERMWRGIAEDDKSAVRKISQQKLKLKRKNRLQDIYPVLRKSKPRKSILASVQMSKEVGQFANYISEDEEECDIPSPKGISSISDVKLLPHYRPKHSEVFKSELSTRKSASSLRLKKKTEPQRSSSVMRTTHIKTKVKESAKPFILLSHLSPNESLKNYFYVDQIQGMKSRTPLIN
jgi:tetratricopeptide (TPR) repeat protein